MLKGLLLKKWSRILFIMVTVIITSILAINMNTVSGAGIISNLSVQDSANSADWSIQSNLQAGNTLYGDRTFTLTTVPASVTGCDWIRTANDSKAYTTDPLVTFTVTQSATVYVAFNDSITTKPSWLSGWTDTGNNLVDSESTPRNFSLYSKSFAANATVSLGNNGSTSAGMYTIIVKSAGGSSTPTPTPTSTPTPVPTGSALPPQNLLSPPQTQTDTTVLLLWEKPTNIYSMTNFASYCVYQNGIKIAETTKMGYTVTGLLPSTSYNFTVRTKNSSGALSADSNLITKSTTATGTVYDVTKYGAVGDGSTVNTKAIQNAINACSSGGTVLIPAGKTFISGALFLKSNMTLKIDGTLKGSTNVNDYTPLIPCRYEGFELNCYASLLTLGKRDTNGPYNISNVTICGSGTIDGSGLDLGNAEKAATENRARGRAICMMNAQNIYVQGLTVSYGPAWTNHAIYSDNVTFSGLNVVSRNSSNRIANGDGIDPDSSTNINIFNCTFKTGDDSIAIKSGKNLEGYTIAKPTDHVRVTDCVIDGSEGGIVIGSEMSGSVRNVLVQNCSISNINWEALDIKSNVVRGGIVENVIYKDITLSNNREAIRVTTNYSVNNDGAAAPVPPILRSISYQNINCTGGAGTAIEVTGLSNSEITNVYFEDCSITSTNGVKVDYADTITFDNVTINNSTGQKYTITNSTNIVTK